MPPIPVTLPSSPAYINNLVDRRPPVGSRWLRWILAKFRLELVRLP